MNSSVKSAVGVAVGSCLLAAVACGGSGEGESPFQDPNIVGSSGSSGEGSSGEGSSGFGSSGVGSSGVGSSGGPECAVQEAAASLTKRPVDIIFAIDNSGSMSEEIIEVEKQVNDNFATIIGASGIDYRVIMVSSHGDSAPMKGQNICVKAPLSGTTCSPIPAKPVETTKFFHHSVQVESTDAWCVLQATFAKPDENAAHPNGWGGLLRPNAFKVFVVISDDRVSCNVTVNNVKKTYNDRVSLNTTVADGTSSAANFDADLIALSPANFGTVAKRNYVWHSIVALKEFNTADKTLAHPATAPIVTDVCTPGAQQPATGHQAMSKLTGGLRYPTCGLNYTTIFKAMAAGVIDGAKVACEFPIPAAPAGQTLDLSTVVPHYTPGAGGAGKDFSQVADAAACAADKFYIKDGKIMLCPATCDAVQADSKAAIKVKFGCAAKGAN